MGRRPKVHYDKKRKYFYCRVRREKHYLGSKGDLGSAPRRMVLRTGYSAKNP